MVTAARCFKTAMPGVGCHAAFKTVLNKPLDWAFAESHDLEPEAVSC